MSSIQDILSVPSISRKDSNSNNKDADNDRVLVSRLQVNPENHTSVISVPRSIVRRLHLTKGQLMSFTVIDDMEDSRIVMKPLRIV